MGERGGVARRKFQNHRTQETSMRKRLMNQKGTIKAVMALFCSLETLLNETDIFPNRIAV